MAIMNIITFCYELITDPVFVTFLALFLGLALGSICYKGFSLGSSGVFFTGFAFGLLGLVMSKYITTFGLIIFMYALGIQGGPSFFNALSKKRLPYIIVALTMSVSTILFTWLGSRIFHFTPDTILGIYTGSMNNSSGLAILMESGWGDAPLPSYGIVYPLGLVCVIFFVQIVPRILRKDLAREFAKEKANQKDENVHLIARKFMVENLDVIGKKMSALDFQGEKEVNISRLRRRGKLIIPHGETVMKAGDIILAVGTEESLEQIHRLLGNETHDDMEIDPRVEAREILITNPSLHHVSLAHLAVNAHYHVVITRIWRSGMELVPTNDFTIELGDSLLAVGKTKNLERIARFLGKKEKTLSEIDLLSMSLGIALGIILGKIPIPIPLIGTITIGTSGGALLVGLTLGYVRRFGFLTGQMSPSAKLVIRELGLSLFIAGIGASAGAGMVFMHLPQVLTILFVSLLMLFLSMTTIFLVTHLLLKMDLVRSLACVCGGMVNSPGLCTLINLTRSEEPTNIFAACYPLSLFFSILATQIFAFLIK